MARMFLAEVRSSFIEAIFPNIPEAAFWWAASTFQTSLGRAGRPLMSYFPEPRIPFKQAIARSSFLKFYCRPVRKVGEVLLPRFFLKVRFI